MNIPFIVYSHSSFDDILTIQNDFIKDIQNEKILLIDKISDNKKYNFDKIFFYDDTLNYSKRIYECLRKIDNKFIIFIHDIDILISKSDDDIFKLVDIMITNNIDRLVFHTSNLEQIKNNNKIEYKNYVLVKNDNINNYIYNVNPSIWNLEKFINLMEKYDCTYRNIERKVQSYCKQNINTYVMTCKNIINAGFFYVTDLFIFLHITHRGKLLDNENKNTNIDHKLQLIYDEILFKYKLNRPMQTNFQSLCQFYHL